MAWQAAAPHSDTIDLSTDGQSPWRTTSGVPHLVSSSLSRELRAVCSRRRDGLSWPRKWTFGSSTNSGTTGPPAAAAPDRPPWSCTRKSRWPVNHTTRGTTRQWRVCGSSSSRMLARIS
eukprot:scaffold47097_cov69-Phaeocystis_antarctica.AAC.2